ncbi:MAG TPA: serine/threonine-protein kinase [Euzebyales bacterium]|nr:serine/threonine-protein kinase [Euzebyales bacterium]
MADEPASARKVADRYRLDRLIGRGGSGAVWRGFDERLRRLVAIKEIAFSADADEADVGRRRALREARAAARLGGEGVVEVYDIVEADGRAYLIMELVDAPNLNTLVRRAGPMTPHAVATLGLRVLDILDTAHRAGIVHRDVKPSNVLIDGDEPRLTDFGIARLGDDVTLTGSGVVMGTPAYIAPEHARGDEIGPAVDIYGLGATLYYAVEGVPPFGSGGSLATVMAVLRDPPRPLERAGPLTDVLEELLVKDPAARPAADALRARLEEIAGTGDDAWEADGRGGTVAVTAALDEWPSTDEIASAAAPSGGDRSSDATTPDDDRPMSDVADAVEGPAVAGPHDVEDAAASGDPGRRRVAVGVALAVLVLTAFALTRADGPGGGGAATATGRASPPAAAGAPAATPSAAVTDAAGAEDPEADGASPTPSEPTAPSPSPTPAADGVLPSYDVDAPDEWMVHDPDDLPYRVAHPPGWEVVRQSATLTDVRDPRTGMYLRLDWVADRRDPVAAWERQEESFAARHAGYERIQLRPTTYRGDRAALWEYRYREGGATLHAYNLGVNRGDNGFALNLQARQSEFDAARELWPYFLASHRFEP